MKTLLICPAERSEMSALEEITPLANLSILGSPLIYHWLEHIAGSGSKKVTILAADRPDQIRRKVGDGSRWGLEVEVVPESHELSVAEARAKYVECAPANPGQNFEEIIVIDHLPGFEGDLFASYAALFSGISQSAATKPRGTQIGMKEIRPGIWVGLHTQISPRAKLVAPCWIGENVLVKEEAEVGPMAVLENGVVVESYATVANACIGRETFVGNYTQVKNSFAFGNTLINFLNSSAVRISDSFLLCALQDRAISYSTGNMFGRCGALVVLLATLPFALITIAKSKFMGHRAFRQRRAIVPQFQDESSRTIVYHELAIANNWWKRWPQLWNVVCGEFAWVGNRPLTTLQAGQLSNEFERLWLAAPIGLVSQGDSLGCTDLSSDEARAHASFYATQANWRFDLRILFRALKYVVGRKTPASLHHSAELKARRFTLAAR